MPRAMVAHLEGADLDHDVKATFLAHRLRPPSLSLARALDTASEPRELLPADCRDHRLADDQNFLHGSQPQRLQKLKNLTDQEGGRGKFGRPENKTPKKTEKNSSHHCPEHDNTRSGNDGTNRQACWLSNPQGSTRKAQRLCFARDRGKCTGVYHVTIRPCRQVRWDRAHPLGSIIPPSGHAVR